MSIDPSMLDGFFNGNIEEHEVVTIPKVELSEIAGVKLVGIVAQSLFDKGHSYMMAVVTASALYKVIEVLQLGGDITLPYDEAFNTAVIKVDVEGTWDVIANNHSVQGSLKALTSGNWLNDDLSPSDKLCTVLDEVTKKKAPTTVGNFVRKVDYGIGYAHTSEFERNSIAILESTVLMKDTRMSNIVRQAIDGDEEVKDNLKPYVADALEMTPEGQHYQVEHKLDEGHRMHPVPHHGVGINTTPDARGCTLYANCPLAYNKLAAMQAVGRELVDHLGPKEVVNDLNKWIEASRQDPVALLTHMVKKGIKKVPVIMQLILLASDLMEHVDGEMLPYNGIAFGRDITTSGMQVIALQVGCEVLLKHVGFHAQTIIDGKKQIPMDVYQLLGKEVAVISYGFSRIDGKAFINGKLYGQGYKSLSKPMFRKDNPELVRKMEEGAKKFGSSFEIVAEQCMKAAVKVLGKKVKEHMAAVKWSTFEYVSSDTSEDDVAVPIITKTPKWVLPCGAKVGKTYYFYELASGELVSSKDQGDNLRITMGSTPIPLENFKLRTNKEDLVMCGLTLLVRNIHSIDSHFCRLVIHNLKEAGATTISTQHDNFMTSFHEFHMLEPAIRMAYMQLFGSSNKANSFTKLQTQGTDLLQHLSDAINEAGGELNISMFYQNGHTKMPKRFKETVALPFSKTNICS